MGLLNDAKRRRKLSTVIIVHHRKVIVLSFIAGVVWFTLLASDSLNNKTYFSENALLPGLVVREFNPGSSINRALENINEETKDRFSTPYTWIQAQFRQIGLDVYSQNFSLHYPFGSKSKYEGNNFYAILRAPKTSSTEALVLSTPYRGFDSIHETTLPSIALMIELARNFRRYSYWSKDLIFLITEHEMIGFQAWLDAYHEVSTSEFINSGRLKGSSGLIQAVINLEISSDKFSHVDIKIEGLNGQLPNLDLFNLGVELCTRESVPTTFQSRKKYSSPDMWETWKHNVLTMLSMMGMQSTGLPTGAHGLFHRYGIQAITLTSKTEHMRNSARVSLTNLGRVLEGMFRSLNNLLEKFHQSFFFYLLSSTRRYVSIGLYMPPFALIGLPLLIKALYLYIDSRISIVKKDDLCVDKYVSLWPALDIIIMSHFIGAIFYFSPNFVDDFMNMTGFSLEDSFYYMHAVLLSLAMLFIYIYNKNIILSHREFSVKLCVVLLEFAAFLYTLSLINISLATALALIYVPITVTLRSQKRFSWLHSVFLLFANPFIVTYLIIVVQSYFVDNSAVWSAHFWHAFTGQKKLVLYTIEDLYFFNNWNYIALTLVLLPLWFELWTLRTTKCDEVK